MAVESKPRRRDTPGPCAAASLEEAWLTPPPQALAFAGGGGVSGARWQDDLGQWCLMTHVTSGAPELSNAEQARLLLERMNSTLGEVGLCFSDVVRTWYFADDILGWYDDFNRVRTGFFSREGLLERMPASTAVGVPLEGGHALIAGALALRPGSEAVTVRPVPSPSQGSAFEYGSSFSRATEVVWPRGRRLYVSGTASIDLAGHTLHAGKAPAQAKQTLRVVDELLRSRGFDFHDVEQATCYFARPEDASELRALVAEHLPRSFPWVGATICRDDLAFEIELVASRENG